MGGNKGKQTLAHFVYLHNKLHILKAISTRQNFPRGATFSFV